MAEDNYFDITASELTDREKHILVAGYSYGMMRGPIEAALTTATEEAVIVEAVDGWLAELKLAATSTSEAVAAKDARHGRNLIAEVKLLAGLPAFETSTETGAEDNG